jgi:hypothetical protein
MGGQERPDFVGTNMKLSAIECREDNHSRRKA